MSCCGGSQSCAPTGATANAAAASTANGTSKTYEEVSEYYGKVLTTSKDLKTSACTASGRPHEVVQEVLRKVPDEVMDKFYGCGAPLPLGIEGLHVLDLGSGSGRDCYVAAALIGPGGSVTGIDMTDEQIEVAERHVDEFTQRLGYERPNMKFVKGHIEYLDKAGVPDESMDMIISNCVVNLSPDKPRVLAEAWRVLKPGGELYFSDVYSDRRVPEAAKKDKVLWGECISGALYVEDFKRIAASVGFLDCRVLSSAPISVVPELRKLLGPTKFYSITYRLFKLPGLMETLCEDYGQVAYYKGTIPGSETEYVLDDGHRFEVGKPYLVCGNTAAMVGEDGVSWLAPHFRIAGDRSTHFGLFANCGGPAPAAAAADTATCAPGGTCC